MLHVGKLASFAGPDAVPVDKVARTFGFGRNGALDAAVLTDEARAHLMAYVAGINGYLKSPAFKLPVEMSLAHIEVTEFTLENVLAMQRLISFKMNYGWYEPIINQLVIDKLGVEKAKELDMYHPRYVPTILPKGFLSRKSPSSFSHAPGLSQV